MKDSKKDDDHPTPILHPPIRTAPSSSSRRYEPRSYKYVTRSECSFLDLSKLIKRASKTGSQTRLARTEGLSSHPYRPESQPPLVISLSPSLQLRLSVSGF